MNVDKFISTGFKLIEEYKYNDYYSSYIFEYNDIIIIIDDNFDISDKGFPYYFYYGAKRNKNRVLCTCD